MDIKHNSSAFVKKYLRETSGSGCIFFFQAEDGIRDYKVTGVQTCALPISVRVYPDPAVRPERVPDRLDPLDVLCLGLVPLGHLDLGRPAARPGHDRGRLLGDRKSVV